MYRSSLTSMQWLEAFVRWVVAVGFVVASATLAVEGRPFWASLPAMCLLPILLTPAPLCKTRRDRRQDADHGTAEEQQNCRPSRSGDWRPPSSTDPMSSSDGDSLASGPPVTSRSVVVEAEVYTSPSASASSQTIEPPVDAHGECTVPPDRRSKYEPKPAAGFQSPVSFLEWVS